MEEINPKRANVRLINHKYLGSIKLKSTQENYEKLDRQVIFR